MIRLHLLTDQDAVMLEGLRISAITTTRLPQIAPNETIRYGNFAIPPGVRLDLSSEAQRTANHT